MQVFCLPHAGGGRSAFAAWDVAMSGVEIIVEPWAQYVPTAGGRGTMDRVVQKVAERIAKLARGDLRLVGASAGARLAYRVAEWLSRHRPEHAPSEVFMLAPPLVNVAGPLERLLKLDDAALVAVLTQLGGIPLNEGVSPQILSIFLRRTRRQLEMIASETSVSRKLGRYALKIIGGDSDPLLSITSLASWSSVVGLDSQTLVWPGDHFFWRDNDDLLELIVGAGADQRLRLHGDSVHA